MGEPQNEDWIAGLTAAAPADREQAARKIRTTKLESAEAALLARLDTEPVLEVRHAVIRALGTVGTRTAAERLIALCAQPLGDHGALYFSAAEALGEMGPVARPVVLAHTEAPEWKVRRCVAMALRQFDDPPTDVLAGLRSDAHALVRQAAGSD